MQRCRRPRQMTCFGDSSKTAQAIEIHLGAARNCAPTLYQNMLCNNDLRAITWLAGLDRRRCRTFLSARVALLRAARQRYAMKREGPNTSDLGPLPTRAGWQCAGIRCADVPRLVAFPAD